MTEVVELHIEAPVEPWQRLGVHVADGRAQVGGVVLRFLPGDRGLVGWGLANLPEPVDAIDGLPTTSASAPAPVGPHHTLGIVEFDHVVVFTDSLERTCGAIEAATGNELRRVREAGPVRQGFHRLGELVVEVVETSQAPAGTASFWGFVLNVSDLHDVCDRLGPEVISLPKAAVQPGRYIATVRASAGLCLPLALMSPR